MGGDSFDRRQQSSNSLSDVCAELSVLSTKTTMLQSMLQKNARTIYKAFMFCISSRGIKVKIRVKELKKKKSKIEMAHESWETYKE